ncbi:hypothetical protein [Alteromonas sp. A079]|uniref:hypothetical protein n=1 Tax=Alteromonas sp. A079 TaxID=3410268 RepID=UPI003BA25EC7
MRVLASYISALSVFFAFTLLTIEFLNGNDGEEVIDVVGITFGMTTGLLISYYVGKVVSGEGIPAHIFLVIPVCSLLLLGYVLETKIGYERIMDLFWVQIYLAGVFAALIMSVIASFLRFLTSSITGQRAIEKHLRRTFPDHGNKKLPSQHVLFLPSLYVFFIFTSWIWFVVSVFSCLFIILEFVKHLFRSESEQFKQIKLPLVSNKNLTIEKTWALLTGYAIVMGTSFKEEDLTLDLQHLSLIHEDFNPHHALLELKNLSILEADTIERTNAAL